MGESLITHSTKQRVGFCKKLAGSDLTRLKQPMIKTKRINKVTRGTLLDTETL